MPRKLIGAVARNANAYLSGLKNAELHRIATLVGSPCSGTKHDLVKGIEAVVGPHAAQAQKDVAGSSLPAPEMTLSLPPLSVVSIDMGIRNLAYAHFSCSLENTQQAIGMSSIYSVPCLQYWERRAISANRKAPVAKLTRPKQGEGESPFEQAVNFTGDLNQILPSSSKESFEPSAFATHAYKFIDGIITRHKPTHVLIERQRFRSGGSSSVQEWTIRVGVFEGMLHAVLETLAKERGQTFEVHSVDPARVSRFWLERLMTPARMKRHLSSKEGKKAKIDIVGEILSGVYKTIPLKIKSTAGYVVDAYIAKWKKSSISRSFESGEELGKLDDLADSLLQGLAWLRWQENRHRLRLTGPGGLHNS